MVLQSLKGFGAYEFLPAWALVEDIMTLPSILRGRYLGIHPRRSYLGLRCANRRRQIMLSREVRPIPDIRRRELQIKLVLWCDCGNGVGICLPEQLRLRALVSPVAHDHRHLVLEANCRKVNIKTGPGCLVELFVESYLALGTLTLLGYLVHLVDLVKPRFAHSPLVVLEHCGLEDLGHFFRGGGHQSW